MKTSILDQDTSWTEISTWCACRQKWYWTYHIGIVPKRKERAPSIGACGHLAIAAMLQKKDWRKAIQNWYEIELQKRELFDEELAEFAQIPPLVTTIMERYQKAYNDTFETVLVEEKFTIPIQGLKARLIGYWDAIVRDKDGNLWLAEHKFPKSRFRSEKDLELDSQIGVYVYAAYRSGLKVVGTIFNQLLARLPVEPKLNKDGTLSRTKIYTDWQTYWDTLLKYNLNPVDYVEMREKLADCVFFKRNYLYRPVVEINTFAKDLYRRIWDLRSSKKHIYRNESAINCGCCAYRELCIESVKGRDLQFIIENEFETKKSREEVENERISTEID